MKLRIRGNSIRLRLGQSEVRRLADQGAVEETTQFDLSGAQRLVYRLETSPDAADLSASFNSGTLTVRIPAAVAQQWASTEQVGMEKVQSLGGAGELRILVEKDFECIDARPDEPQDDAYPHPNNPRAPADRPWQTPAG